MPNPLLISSALLSACFALAVTVEPRMAALPSGTRHDRSPVEIVFGESRRMFAGQFFVKADVYFHSGYYPSIFDQAGQQGAHLTTGAGLAEGKPHEEDFLGQPLDFIDRFGRAFFPSVHTHLGETSAVEEKDHDHDHSHETPEEHAAHSSPQEIREMLPWIRMTAELDPNRIETYTVAAFWLRTRLNQPQQAEAFLRDGLKANPESYAILFELGRIYAENHHQPDRARNLWEAAFRLYKEQGKQDDFMFLQIVWHLALLEQTAGHTSKAISYLEMAKSVSPNPASVQSRIDELRQATASHPAH